MARWRPGAAERLQKAALDLFAAHGYDRTTAADIAARAGLTERTFFRYFADKRDVLFHGQDAFVGAFTTGVAEAPTQASPLDLISASLEHAATWFPDERRPHARLRRAVIDANPALQERERNKLAGLALALADALRQRGVGDPAATLAAETGATVFGIAFVAWIAEGERRPFAEIAADTLAQLRALTA